jgi:ectoine hydroxylase-related dioxygenase (phytanoyl-CoA dioxygenase family)
MKDAAQMADSGYSIERSVLSSQDCDDLIAALSNPAIRVGRAGARHLMSISEVTALATDARLLAIARSWLGEGAIPFRATLFEKSGHANWLVVWHQDTALPLDSYFDAPGWGPWSKKAGILYSHAPAWALSRILALRVHLDPSTNDNGPLRIIPGSHADGVLTDDEVSSYAKVHSHIECIVPRGGVLAMRPLLIHSSSKARSTDPRRVLHIEYAESVELKPGIRLAVA